MQDSLAQAVAEEMQKVYRSELGPLPVPSIIPTEAITEEDVSIFSLIFVEIANSFININNVKEKSQQPSRIKRLYECENVVYNAFNSCYMCSVFVKLQKYFLDADGGSNDEGSDASEPKNMNGDETIRFLLLSLD